MSRWKQTARKSTGGQAPRKVLASKAAKKLREFEKSQTPLHRAATNGSLAILRALLKRTAARVDGVDAHQGTALHYAAENGHEEAVKILLAKEASISTQDIFGGTALQRAAKNGHQEIVRILLAKEASVTPQDKTGRTAMDHAVTGCHWETVKLLLCEGHRSWRASQNMSENTGQIHRPLAIDDDAIISAVRRTAKRTKLASGLIVPPTSALQVAAHLGLEDMMLRLILEQGSCVDGSVYRWYDSPLYYATAAGHQGCVAILISHGASLRRPEYGEGPLDCALQHDHHGIASILLHAGARVSCKSTAGLLIERGIEIAARLLFHIQPLEALTSSLLEISRWKHVPLLQEYFRAIRPVVRTKYARQRSPSPACKLVKMLLRSPEKISAGTTSVRNTLEASLDENFDAVYYLLSIFQPEALRDLQTMIPSIRTKADAILPSSIDRTDSLLLGCLLKAGFSLPSSRGQRPISDTSWLDPRVWTPLHQACQAGSATQAYEILQQDVVDIDAKGLRDRTPLHLAAHNGHANLVVLLIRRGANLEAKTSLGSTAEALAIQRGYHHIARLLTDAKGGKNCSSVGRGGLTV